MQEWDVAIIGTVNDPLGAKDKAIIYFLKIRSLYIGLAVLGLTI